MTVDEKGLEAAIAALCEIEKIGPFDQLWPSDQAWVRSEAIALITAYESAKSAEPVAWQDLSTAPDENVLVAHDGWVSEARYHPDYKGWWLANTDPTDAHDGQVYPTKWRHLPAHPAPEASDV